MSIFFLIKCMIVNQTTLYDHILQAGIDSNMLTIALEPEAAAIYVKHLPVDRRLDGEGGDLFRTFAPGSKYIVVDAGGMHAGKGGIFFKFPFKFYSHLFFRLASKPLSPLISINLFALYFNIYATYMLDIG